ncbi:MAG TPA: sigma-70 family RNA polymerase sigma factor [bacterium]|jgi:RNA polymerase sigma factor (sigma-70 family)|nr:sigma-70 family RNA polymerase sigma factor [bacterium]
MADTVDENLAGRFQAARPRLTALALRMLGSTGEAEDAVQEAWLRLSRVDAAAIQNLDGWLTTVVARVCLDLLRRRKTRNEEELDGGGLDSLEDGGKADPEQEALLAESVGQAMLLVLDRLPPAERVAFVLHDLFDLPFADVALILERSEENARKLASRGRKRIKDAKDQGRADGQGKREMVEAFLAASRLGDFSALLKLLDPQVVLKADATAVRIAAANQANNAPALPAEAVGAGAVAEVFKGKASGARLVYVHGEPAAAWIQGGAVRSLFLFTAEAGRITGVRVVMDPSALGALDVSVPA